MKLKCISESVPNVVPSEAATCELLDSYANSVAAEIETSATATLAVRAAIEAIAVEFKSNLRIAYPLIFYEILNLRYRF